MIVTIRSYLSGHNGYGHLAEQLGISLEQIGCEVRLDPYGEIEAYGFSPWVQSKIRTTENGVLVGVDPPAGVSLVVNMPDQLYPLDLPTCLFTMWETTRLPYNDANFRFSVPYLNHAHAIAVPCRWNAENFAAEGVTTPITVVPLGVADIYRPAPMVMDGPTRFGFAARVAHGPPRKRVHEAIKAFGDAFPRGTEDVRLHIRCGERCMGFLGPIDDERIHICSRPLSDAEMVAWYQRMTVGLFPSSGEGWGFNPLQMMACGRPVIACKYSGHAEYFDADSGWEIEYDEVPATGLVHDGLGNWAMPRHDSMVAAMRDAHNNRELCDDLGQQAAGIAFEFSWERTALTLRNVLEGIA